jgi:glutamate carboxypeptidase
VSHLDTVFPPEEEIRNDFAWREEGDRIYGPGTVDIKGGTVLIYMMMAGLQALLPEVYEAVTWVILLDASEEADAEDFGALCIERLEGPDTLACLIFEGGYFDNDEFWLVTARKGMAVCEVHVEGRAAHAGSSHELGANAIVQLAETVQKLAAITDYERNITVNVGTVNGGTVTNRVPHQATAALEMRAFDTETYDAAVEAILALNGPASVQSAADGYPCRVEVEVLRKTAPWSRNEATDRLLAVWQEVGESLGYHVRPEERGGLSDGNMFWQAIPTLDGLGVAGGNAHCSERSADGSKEQEYCEVSSFVPKAVLNVTAVLKLLSRYVVTQF